MTYETPAGVALVADGWQFYFKSPVDNSFRHFLAINWYDYCSPIQLVEKEIHLDEKPLNRKNLRFSPR